MFIKLRQGLDQADSNLTVIFVFLPESWRRWESFSVIDMNMNHELKKLLARV